MVSDDGTLFYVTCSCYKLKKCPKPCYAEVLIGILRLSSYFLMLLFLFFFDKYYFLMHLRRQRMKRQKILFGTPINCGELKPNCGRIFSNPRRTDVGKFKPPQERPISPLSFISIFHVSFIITSLKYLKGHLTSV